jgi:hypothetical protein
MWWVTLKKKFPLFSQRFSSACTIIGSTMRVVGTLPLASKVRVQPITLCNRDMPRNIKTKAAHVGVSEWRTSFRNQVKYLQFEMLLSTEILPLNIQSGNVDFSDDLGSGLHWKKRSVLCLWPVTHIFCLWPVNTYILFVTSNTYVPVKNSLSWSALVFCACTIIWYYLVVFWCD